MGFWKWILPLVLLSLAHCGKNEAFVPVGSQPPVNQPVTQAPPPNVSPTQPGSGVTFNPTLPAGYPNSYTPFLPIDQYMRQPGRSEYWTYLWNSWVYYASQYQISPYDFNYFWYNYCPQQWYGTDMWSTYQYFDSYVYYWVDPYSSYSYSSYDPYSFWSNYQGFQYWGIDPYSCYYTCY